MESNKMILEAADLEYILKESARRIMESGEYEGFGDNVLGEFPQLIAEMERKIREAKEFRKVVSAKGNEILAPVFGKPVMVYFKFRAGGGHTADGTEYKMPMKIDKVNWFGNNVYLHGQSLITGFGNETLDNENYDFNTMRIIEISPEEAERYRGVNQFGYMKAEEEPGTPDPEVMDRAKKYYNF